MRPSGIIFECFLFELFGKPRRHCGFDESGRHRVTSNVTGGDFTGDGHGQSNQARLGSRIVRLPRLADLTKDRSYVDNPSPALLEHGADHLLNAQVCRGQVGIEHSVPIGALHTHNKLVAGDARIVHQDVDLAKLSDDRLARSLDLVFVGDVYRESAALPPDAAISPTSSFNLS